MTSIVPHEFAGRSDRWCTVCNLADRHPIHDPSLREPMLALRERIAKAITDYAEAKHKHVGSMVTGECMPDRGDRCDATAAYRIAAKIALEVE